MKALIVEDDPFKLDHIRAVVGERYSNWDVVNAMSAHAAKAKLLEVEPQLVLLDMSLPSFDIGENESGGRPLNFGGIDVIRFIHRKRLDSKAIVITQFEEFVEGSDVHNLQTLGQYLTENFSDIFLGIVYFDPSGQWTAKLIKLIDEETDERGAGQ